MDAERLELIINDNEKFEFTFTMLRLYKLQSYNFEAYERFSRALFDSNNDIISNSDILYGAYLMNLLDNEDDFYKALSYEDFLSKIDNPQIGLQKIINLAGSLTTSKKK